MVLATSEKQVIQQEEGGRERGKREEGKGEGKRGKEEEGGTRAGVGGPQESQKIATEL